MHRSGSEDLTQSFANHEALPSTNCIWQATCHELKVRLGAAVTVASDRSISMFNEKAVRLRWCVVLVATLLACAGSKDDGQGSGAGGSSSSSSTSSGASGSTGVSSGTSGSGTSGASGAAGAAGGDTDDAGGPSGEGGLSCGTQAGACVNATDCAIGKDQIDPKVATCAKMCGGGSKCTADCLVKDGVTTACAQCWGDVTQCGR